MVVQPVTAPRHDADPPNDEVPGAPARTPTPATPMRGAARAGIGIALECGGSLLAAMLFLAWSGSVNINPMFRVGQVAGLATLQLRFAVVCIVVVVALLLAERFLPPARQDLAVRTACAIFAGLASGLVAAGIRVALRGTPWALYVGHGDGGWISQWVQQLRQGQSIPAHYPPLSIYLMAGYEQLTGRQFWFALKDFQLVGTALYGPAAYLTWRLLLRPAWALGIGVLAALALINPLKPYPQLALVIFLPLVLRFLQVVRRSAGLTGRQAASRGALFGLGLGLLFLLYSGWFVWAAIGVVAAFLGLVPWRQAGKGRPALVLAGTATVVFLAVGWIHLRGLFASTGALSDQFFYFDTDTEPTYFAMWRDDAPGNVGVWPPSGELAGVGLFTLLLAAGLLIALALGWRRTIVVGIGSCLLSAWLMRMWFAGDSYRTWSVRLYPRTTMMLFYGLVALTGFALYLVAGAVAQRAGPAWRIGAPNGADPSNSAPNGADPSNSAPNGADRSNSDAAESGRRFGAAAPFALLLCPLLFVFASAGSAVTDRYMPRNEPGNTGYYAWVSHNTRLPNGFCPWYTRWADPPCQLSLATAPASTSDPTPTPGR